MEKYDIVVAGGGQNGLIAAAYLARAGLSVCVVERSNKAGGGLATEEVTQPGFKHDLASIVHQVIQFNPLLENDELGLLSKHGLSYVTPERQVAVVFPDGRSLVFYRDLDKTCESIAQFSQKDAEAYKRFYYASDMVFNTLIAGVVAAPMPFGNMMGFMDSSDEGREMVRAILGSSVDITKEWFESDEVNIALSRFASEAMVMPQEKGTGCYLSIFIPSLHKKGFAYPVGGSAELARSLERCILAAGGTIRLSSTVKSIKMEGGEAKGVVLDTGEEILAAKAVISNLNVKQLFLDMVAPQYLPEGFTRKVNRLQHSTFVAFHQALALNEAPQYKAGSEVSKTAFVEYVPSSNLEDCLRVFEDMAHGMPTTNMPLMATPTLADPTRAPEGKHTMYLYHYAPTYLRGGLKRWDEIKQEVADEILGTVQSITTNMGSENILGRWAHSPLDYEKFNPAWPQGDFMHMAAFVYQYFGNRPMPGWSGYKSPVDKLYMCGGSTHPGGGVCGGSGRAAAETVMGALGIDFGKVASGRV